MPKKAKKKVGNKAERDKRKKTAEYFEFIRFEATPEPFRDLKTDQDFAEKYNVNDSTLSEWRKRLGFYDAVQKENRQMWGRKLTPNVLAGLYRRAVKHGNAQEVKLWLQYIEDWAEKNKHEFDFANMNKEQLVDYIMGLLNSDANG